MSLYTSSIPSLTTVVYKRGPQYGGHIATTSTVITAGYVVCGTAFQNVKDLNTPVLVTSEHINPEHTISVLAAADVTTEGIKKIEDTTVHTGTVPIVGTGALEALIILGIATSTIPIDYGDRWTDTVDATAYGYNAIYGSQDIRKASYVREGMCWIPFEGATLPAIGVGVVPSATTNGFVSLGTDRLAEITIGITVGTRYDGTNRHVLVILTPDGW